MSSLSMGSDPEFMIQDVDGNHKSAIEILKAGKTNKIRLSNKAELFYDNVLMEMNIPPANDKESLINNVNKVFSETAFRIKPFVFVAQASHTYPVEECKHPDAFVFGCEPEYCAYEMTQIQPPSCEKGNTFRSAGGHIHLGQEYGMSPLNIKFTAEDETENQLGKLWVVRMMDLFVGVPSIFLDSDPTSPTRRKLYGRAGSHRPKKEYGVEYRATGNFWLKSPALVGLMFDLCEFVIDFCGTKRYEKLWSSIDDCTGYSVKELMACINDSNKSAGKNLMESVVKKEMPPHLYNEIILMCGEKNSSSLYKEWNLRRL